MVEHIEDFDYIVTDGEFEALVLECNLIKLHRPIIIFCSKTTSSTPSSG
jgi:excinuclease UvrABC nuclease subunit